MSLPSDERYTPDWILEFIRARWGVPDLDVAGCKESHLAARWYSREQDALAEGRSWAARMAVGNPPYSRKGANGVRDYLADFTRRGRLAIESGEVERIVWIVPDTAATGWWRHNLVRDLAEHLRRERVRVAEGVTAWFDSYRDGLCRAEVVTAMGRVAFAAPAGQAPANKSATGKSDTALVMLARADELRSEQAGLVLDSGNGACPGHGCVCDAEHDR